MKKLNFFSLLLAVTVIVSLSQFTEKNLLMAAAQEDWMSEFEDVCSKTQDSMTLSSDELKGLISRCDKLNPVISKLEGPQRKVYLKRLRLCRDLFVFVLESKERK
jgi:hypothetical protein